MLSLVGGDHHVPLRLWVVADGVTTVVDSQFVDNPTLVALHRTEGVAPSWGRGALGTGHGSQYITSILPVYCQYTSRHTMKYYLVLVYQN